MINPHDIINKEFSKKLKGYCPEEVDEYLDELVVEVQASYREMNALRAKVETLNEKLEKYTKLEKTLQDTLMMAQETAKNVKEQAQREADSMLSKARDEAQNMGVNSQAENIEIQARLHKSKLEFENYRRRILTFMESQMMSFDAMTKDMGVNNSLTSLEPQPIEEMDDTYDFTENSPLG